MTTAAAKALPSNESLLNKRTAAYWVVTGLLALNLFGSGVAALTQQQFLIVIMERLGYPPYVMYFLPIGYLLAAVALVAPRYPLVKEWAYAGVVFAMIGAVASHAFSGDAITEYVAALIVLSLAVASYTLRPASRRLVLRTP